MAILRILLGCLTISGIALCVSLLVEPGAPEPQEDKSSKSPLRYFRTRGDGL